MSDDHDSIENGFSIAWLAEAFKMSPQTVRNRLSACPFMGQRGRGRVYDLEEAASRLVNPEIDWTKVTKADLPVHLRKEIWDARLKQQKFEKEAKELWLTDDVVESFTRVFLVMKSNVQLWPDVVERQIGLSREQRDLLISLGDALLEDVFGEIQKVAAENSTPSSVAELDGLDAVVL